MFVQLDESDSDVFDRAILVTMFYIKDNQEAT
jgi:hypothetical protein